MLLTGILMLLTGIFMLLNGIVMLLTGIFMFLTRILFMLLIGIFMLLTGVFMLLTEISLELLCCSLESSYCSLEFLAHLSSAQDELLWSLFVRRPSVRASVNIFKWLLLWNRWANFAQISYGASLGWGNEKLLIWLRSFDQDGRHAHIW